LVELSEKSENRKENRRDIKKKPCKNTSGEFATRLCFPLRSTSLLQSTNWLWNYSN